MRLVISFITLLSLCQVFAQNNIEYLLKAAERGDINAQRYLVDCYMTGNRGIQKNYSEAYTWIERLAENGDSIAQYELATNSDLKNIVNSRGLGQIYWLEQAANSRHPLALEDYGVFLYSNEEYEKAVPILMDAAQSGYSLKAMFLLGYCYNMGLGVKPNKEMAAQQFLLVTKLGEMINCKEEFIAKAYYENAKNYMSGEGVDVNLELALYNIDQALKSTLYPQKSRNYLVLYDLKGSIKLLMGDDKAAKSIWNEIIASDPEYPSEAQTFLCCAMTGNIDYFIPSSDNQNLNTFAIVIANENYKRVPNVPFAHNDGNIFRKYLISSFGVPEDNIEYLEDASLNDIKYALANVSQRCNAFRDQVSVIVYYAGHGVPDDKTAEAFLLPVDGFGTDPSSGLNLDDFYASLSEMPAKSIVVLLDACFSGAKRDGGMLMATRGITIKPKMQVPDGKLIVLSATSNDETAFPIEQQKHGLFTYTLLRKIQETGGDITWGELADHVTATVKNRSIDINGKLQTPTVSVSSSMKDIWRNLKLR